MLHRTKHATTNYKMLKPFIDTVDANEGYCKFKSGGYMDLVVEKLYYTDGGGNDVYSITHYGKQNGDLMCDPDMTFAIDREHGRIYPRSYQNDYIGIYQEVFSDNDRRYRPGLFIELDGFLWQWLKNIEAQGFKAA